MEFKVYFDVLIDSFLSNVALKRSAENIPALSPIKGFLW
ncbi:hypothetical protein CSC17_0185 [Klebsiella oxytoca]|nr:hypothetical protein CSC17_0185 [Klebsiella oxytoca]